MPAKLSRFLPLLVLGAAGFVFLWDYNELFYAGPTIQPTQHSAAFTAFFDWTLEDLTSGPNAVTKVLLLGYNLTFLPHGSVPPVYFGLIYKIFDVLGVPFTPPLFQLPNTLFAMAAVVLFYLTLVRAKISPAIALLATGCLIFSPIFVANARGIGTYWVVAIVFNQALGIFALQSLERHRHGKIVVAIALVHILMSDVLSFLVLAALTVGYGLRNYSFTRETTRLTLVLAHLRQSLKPLINKTILIPGLITFAIVSLTTILMLVTGKAEIAGLPLYPILLYWAVFAHGSEGMSFESADLGLWDTRLVYSLGDAGVLLVIAAVLVSILVRGHHKRGVLWPASCLAAGGFGILFYVMANDHPTTRYMDQVYTLIPFLAFAAYQFDRLSQVVRWGHLIGCLIFAATLVGAVLATVTLIWSVPLSRASSELIIQSDNEETLDAYGNKRPNLGYRAAGYLVREILAAEWPGVPEKPLDVFYGFTNHIEGRQAFILFAGLYQRGDWFANQFQIEPSIIYRRSANGAKDEGGICDGRTDCVVSTTSKSDTQSYQTEEALGILPCTAQFCVTLKLGEVNDEFFHYEIWDGAVYPGVSLLNFYSSSDHIKCELFTPSCLLNFSTH